MSEFYDLSERLLNSGDAYWGNLGYWHAGNDYSQACENLAHRLACAVKLTHNSRIFDAGFGCGDQLLLWRQAYNVQFLSGINYSISQTHLARQRLEQSGNSEQSHIHCEQEKNASLDLTAIYQGDVTQLSQYSALEKRAINCVLALDCAYHFPSRQQFFSDSFQLLTASRNTDKQSVEQGRIGLTDIVLATEDLPWYKKIVLNTMLMLSQIPQHNIVTAKVYQKQLEQSGFSNVEMQDISAHVFEPFGHWLAKRPVNKKEGRGALIKYKVTSRFLAWAYRHSILRYLVISASVAK